jgi:hypothetical protein
MYMQSVLCQFGCVYASLDVIAKFIDQYLCMHIWVCSMWVLASNDASTHSDRHKAMYVCMYMQSFLCQSRCVYASLDVSARFIDQYPCMHACMYGYVACGFWGMLFIRPRRTEIAATFCCVHRMIVFPFFSCLLKYLVVG